MAADTPEAAANRKASMTRSAAPSAASADSDARAFEGRSRFRDAAVIRVDRLMPDPDQPRTEFDPEALEQLAGSLRARGQLQPIRARWSAEADRYIIVVGERRWRAAALAGIEALECVVVDGNATPDEILEDQLVENALRADLKPVEQGRAYDRLMKARGLSQRALAERLNVSQAAVAKAVALLTLPEPIQTEVDAGSIGPDIAYQLSKIDDVREQAEMAGRASEGRLRRDEIKERTRATSSLKGKSTGKGKAKRPTVRAIRVEGGSKVTVENRKGLDGQLIVAALELALATARAELGDDQVAA
jgi:ParB family transcriptional regulator, chromosome partitioning protein